MKVSVILALVAAATVVSAETNAGRFARGLGPMAPIKRGSKSSSAKKNSPSGTPNNNGNNCSAGNQYCCNSVGTSGDNGYFDDLLGIAGLSVPSGTSVAANCDSLASTTCSQTTTCCTGTQSTGGLININCSPISL